jgi:hypothetical protein
MVDDFRDTGELVVRLRVVDYQHVSGGSANDQKPARACRNRRQPRGGRPKCCHPLWGHAGSEHDTPMIEIDPVNAFQNMQVRCAIRMPWTARSTPQRPRLGVRQNETLSPRWGTRHPRSGYIRTHKKKIAQAQNLPPRNADPRSTAHSGIGAIRRLPRTLARRPDWMSQRSPAALKKDHARRPMTNHPVADVAGIAIGNPAYDTAM